MTLTYANILTRVRQMLQDTASGTYGTTELGMWIEECLKEFSTYIPHIVPVVFQMESRTGTDDAGTTDKLTDAAKTQFLTTDDEAEKVVHNTTDNTWAVVETATTSIYGLNVSIMASGEAYAIYNKRCWNRRQIFIGDMAPYLWIDSVEYPIGTLRSWKVYDQVLEVDVDSVADSNLTQSPRPNIDVLVRFAMPHILSQLTDWDGAVNATEAKGDVSIAIDGMGNTEIIEVGEEFHIADHRTLYIVTTEATTSGNAVADLGFYPPLEAAAADTDAVTFRKTTLKPQHEEIFCHLVAARAVLSDNINYINEINKGGVTTWKDFRQWAVDKLSETLGKLEKVNAPRTKRIYPR